MGTYRPLFSITVEHAYFSGHSCKMLEFVPTSSSTAMLRNAGLLLKSSESGVAVYFDHGNIDILRLHAADNLTLTFKVFAKDPNFLRYTAPGAPPDQAILFFNNRAINRDDPDKQLLHGGATVAEDSWADMAVEPLASILDRKDLLIKPAFILQMNITADAQGLCSDKLDPAARKFFIRFGANQTFWNYYVLGELSKRAIYIADLDNAVQFKSIGNVTLPGQREALVLQSSVAIPMQEHSRYRLQLRESGNMGDKVLIKRLPNASVDQTFSEMINGKMENVSEIFVN
ncbi:MAG: hypothetical protein K2Y09_11805 [Nitrosomonas sp.]|uniref:hypothetical protein n=1 Tax=Nitrosomonas sp. TaxID=42353 RepID=UPI001D2A9575|nr:hypothetical protein [Nitrosomonas sp.]MBX9895838.1 hypothetical protein [Nitrosomonas sp.]